MIRFLNTITFNKYKLNNCFSLYDLIKQKKHVRVSALNNLI